MEDVDELKRNMDGKLTYRLERADVYVSSCGFHFIDYLDPMTSLSPEINNEQLTGDKIEYIEKTLQSNADKFRKQADVLLHNMTIEGSRILDIGCGGGLFLSLLKQKGAAVVGVELNDARAWYAQTRHGINVVKRPVEDEYWAEFHGSFDGCTLWDVIEHVNFPRATLQSASRLLKAGGILIIDTPCRDSFYHRIGELTYRLSAGKYPTFLNAIYSARPFGHKQIFSTREMKKLLESLDMQVIEQKKFHELSFPYSFYLTRLFKSDRIAKWLLPLVKLAFFLFPVKNKMLVVARKVSGGNSGGRNANHVAEAAC